MADTKVVSGPYLDLVTGSGHLHIMSSGAKNATHLARTPTSRMDCR